MPKLHEKEIIRSGATNEVAQLLHFIEPLCDGLSNHQRAYYEKTKERDFAIRQITGKDFKFYELNYLDRKKLDKVFKENNIEAVNEFCRI